VRSPRGRRAAFDPQGNPERKPLVDLGYLSDVLLYLALVVDGVPLAAIAAGWLLAGLEPPAIATAVIE
jgi:hypothetical protein